jgi:predicted phage terminase large subunit-like protein
MGLQNRIKEAEAQDVNFPKFVHIKYPAKRYDEQGKFISYLWPELYPNEWYDAQYSINRGHFASALLDCEPMPETGNRFDCSKIQEHDLVEFPEGRYKRAWDLASSTKERDSSDPDYTIGVFGLIQRIKVGQVGNFTKSDISEEVHFWIKDIKILREKAPRRNEIIIQTALKDSPRTPILVEDYGAYKDSYTTLRHLLTGYNVVGQHLHKEKSAKAAGLEPIFSHGRIHIPKGATWRNEFIKQFMNFPEGHDDIVDACSIIYNDTMHENSSILVIK